MSSTLQLQHLRGDPRPPGSVPRHRAARSAPLTPVARGFLPPHLLLLCSMFSVQLGSALATSLFPALGSTGTVFLRLTVASLLLLLVWRPRLRDYTRRDVGLVVLFGLCIAGLNGFFYASIARIPLGIAVTLEFVGPLAVALASSRRLPDLCWALLAAAGIILLAPIQGTSIDLVGVGLALVAAGCWAAYILLSVRVGRVFPGGTGLALGMSVGAMALAPFGMARLTAVWHDPSLLLIGAGVALLSSVIPFSLELEALRRLPARIFSVLLSLEPVLAALIGLVVLGQTVGLRAIVSMALIVFASGGVSFSRKGDA